MTYHLKSLGRNLLPLKCFLLPSKIFCHSNPQLPPKFCHLISRNILPHTPQKNCHPHPNIFVTPPRSIFYHPTLPKKFCYPTPQDFLPLYPPHPLNYLPPIPKKMPPYSPTLFFVISPLKTLATHLSKIFCHTPPNIFCPPNSP